MGRMPYLALVQIIELTIPPDLSDILSELGVLSEL
jgi:hypothetical protein